MRWHMSGFSTEHMSGLSTQHLSSVSTRHMSSVSTQHMSYVPKPQFGPRIGSPWLGVGSNSARMNRTASRNLSKPLPALREPVFGPKTKKHAKCIDKLPINRPSGCYVVTVLLQLPCGAFLLPEYIAPSPLCREPLPEHKSWQRRLRSRGSRSGTVPSMTW